MDYFTQANRDLLANSLLVDYRFYQQDILERSPGDQSISKAVSILQEAIAAAYNELTKDDPKAQAEMIAITGTDLPPIDVHQMEAPASVFQSITRLCMHMHPDAAMRIVGYRDQMYKIYQRRSNEFKLLATLTNPIE